MKKKRGKIISNFFILFNYYLNIVRRNSSYINFAFSKTFCADINDKYENTELMLLKEDNIKCVFFHSEEVGCVGSRNADMDWLKDVILLTSRQERKY